MRKIVCRFQYQMAKLHEFCSYTWRVICKLSGNFFVVKWFRVQYGHVGLCKKDGVA